eukprot:6099828-Pleurochrysis_carterae.AAC.2
MACGLWRPQGRARAATTPHPRLSSRAPRATANDSLGGATTSYCTQHIVQTSLFAFYLIS